MIRAAMLAVALSTTLSPVSVSAQPSVSGALRGTVTDEQGQAMADVTIEATGPSIAGRRHAVSDETGAYRLPDLPPGEYALIARRDGFSTIEHRSIVVRASLSVTVDLVLRVGSVDVSVDVTVNEPLFDTARAIQATNISGELQGRLPLSSRRNWADFLLVTPGIVSNDGAQYYNHGSTFDSHVMQLDGVDLAAASQNVNSLIQLNPELLEDVQVKTAGIDAGTPLGTGVIISMASRAGTDAFHGTQVLTIRPQSWTDSNNPAGTTSATRLAQADLSLGGPIWRQRWWFFAADRLLSQGQEISRTPEQLATLRALAPGFEPFANEFSAQIPFLRVTGQLTGRHQIYGMLQSDRTPSEFFGRAIDAQRLTRTFLGGGVQAVALRSVWPSWLTRVLVSRNAKRQGSSALGEGPAQVVHRSAFPSSGVLFGSGPIAFLGNAESAFRDRSTTWTLSFDATHFRTTAWGSHELAAGMHLQQRHQERTRDYTNGGFAQEQLILRDPSNPAAGTIAFKRLTFTPPSVTDVLDDGRDGAFYLRDIWTIGSRLTLNLGLRADVIRRVDGLFDAQTQHSIDIGPRLGVTYALTTDGRHVARASWGRVHDALSSNTILVGDDTGGFRDEYDVDLNGVFETVLESSRITTLSNRLVLDPDRGQPYAQEWTLGYGWRLPRQTSIDASVIRRAYRNRTAFIDINSMYEGERFIGYRNPNVNEIYEVTGNRWNTPVYTGIELRVTRQTGALQLIGGYTRGFQHLDGTWQPNDPAAFIQPDDFANDKGIGSVSGGRSPGLGSLSGFADVSGPQWRNHVLRAGVTYQAPWRVVLASTYSFQSGAWSGPIVTRIDAPDPRFGEPLVTLSNGRLVSNPLATTIRFAYATRGDGQFALRGVHAWNTRLGCSFAIPALRSRAEAALDVYNVPNLSRDHFVPFGANQLYNPSFGTGGGRQLPRSAALSVRVSF